MQRWQQKQRQKAHQSIIINAKSTLKRYSNSREKVLTSSRSKMTPHKKQMMPVNKILSIFQLEQYGWLLLAHGFPQNLTQKHSLDYIDDMLVEVAEQDKQRFLSLLNTLTIMSKDLRKTYKTPKQTSTKSKKVIYPPPSTSTQSKPTPSSLQKSQKTTSKFRIKNKNSIHLHHPLHNEEIIKKPPRVNRDHSIPGRKQRRKSVTHSKGLARDDISIIHDFRSHASGQICETKEANRLLLRLMEKLQHPETGIPNNPSNQQIKLEMQKIKQMYLSFDSATLNSNITNIDMQQMVECFSVQVQHMIEKSEVNKIASINQQKIKSLLHESFIMVKQESKESRTQNEQIEENLRPESQDQQVIIKRRVHNIKEGNQIQDQIDNSSNDACSIGGVEIENSSIWGHSYIGSIINDFSCFDNQFKDSVYVQKPQIQDIRNFIGLIVMAGKMEKEVPIIAYVYLLRLLQKAPNSRVTVRNWRNLLLVTLIEASKIWDDQSLENNSFAKVIKPYTTLEINRLQKYLLFFLDYHLNVNQKQYSNGYFGLRKHTGETSHTANLMRLDLKTIQKLQAIGSKQEPKKKQFFKKCMNKSF